MAIRQLPPKEVGDPERCDFLRFPFDASTLLSIDPELCRRVDFDQGGEPFDGAQDGELVERPVEPRVSPSSLSGLLL